MQNSKNIVGIADNEPSKRLQYLIKMRDDIRKMLEFYNSVQEEVLPGYQQLVNRGLRIFNKEPLFIPKNTANHHDPYKKLYTDIISGTDVLRLEAKQMEKEKNESKYRVNEIDTLVSHLDEQKQDIHNLIALLKQKKETVPYEQKRKIDDEMTALNQELIDINYSIGKYYGLFQIEEIRANRISGPISVVLDSVDAQLNMFFNIAGSQGSIAYVPPPQVIGSYKGLLGTLDTIISFEEEGNKSINKSYFPDLTDRMRATTEQYKPSLQRPDISTEKEYNTLSSVAERALREMHNYKNSSKNTMEG